MITFLKGTIEEIQEEYLVMDVNDIGYKVFMTFSDMTKIALKEEAKIHIEMIVREDDVSLYGFLTPFDRQIFNHLRTVSGIGVKTALNMLQKFNGNEIVHFVVMEDHNILTQIPGIGKKTAARLVIELKDKFSSLPKLEGAPLSEEVGEESQKQRELLDAMESLGYTRSRIHHLLKGLDYSLSIEELIKIALQRVLGNRS